MRQQKSKSLLYSIFMLLILFGLLFPTQTPATAATLTVELITWNVIGLDSNNVNVGPNHFPVGARVCNTSGSDTTATVTFIWDDSYDKFANSSNPDPYINLRSGTLDVITLSIAANNCADAYFEAEVTRDSNAYNHVRPYYITAQDGSGTVSTTTPRELFVEHLISQSRNSVSDMQLSTNGVDFNSISPGGTMTLMIGETYWIKLVGSTATNGYEQIENFINFPNIIFQTLAVETTYTAETSGNMASPYTTAYGNACVWENNPNSPNYRSCLSTGKAGGDITVTYKVKILSVPVSPLINPEALTTLIYDFSGSSYHYNSDFSAETRFANIVNASITKSFSPKTINPGETSTLTFKITNPGPSPISDVNFSDSDSWPSGMQVASSTVTYTNCGSSPSPTSLTVDATSVSFSGITVAGYGTCTIALTVKFTATVTTTYTNTTNNLFINTIDTGSNATDSLIVTTKPPAPSTCTDRVTIATWTMPTSGQGSVWDSSNRPEYTTKVVDVSTASTTGSTGTFSIDTTTTGSTSGVNSWGSVGWTVDTPPTYNTSPYYEFVLDTSNYGGVQISAAFNMLGANGWKGNNNNSIFVFSEADNSGTYNNSLTNNGVGKNKWDNTVIVNVAVSTGLINTKVRIMAMGAASPTSVMILDDISFTGCPRPNLPTLSKAFSPTSIAQGSASTLTFSFINPNSSTALTGVGFKDTLPAGLVIATPNGLTTPSCTTGSLSGQTISAPAGTSVIQMSGGTLAANSSCSFSVNIKGNVAGYYTNISESITSSETGPNTGPNGYGTSSLTVVAPPVIAKVFGATTIITGNTTTLKFSIYNPNLSTTLTGVQFTDNLPGGLVVATPNGLSGSCGGGTITATPGSSTISLSGASLVAGATCTFSVNVTGTITVGDPLKHNSVTVSSTNGGTGNTSTADLLVKDLTPSLSLLKQVGASSSGPWYDSLIIPAGNEVWYKFTVENTGDAPLDPVTLTDDTFTPSCTWSNPVTPLPVAVATNDLHISTCIVQNGNAAVGSVKNTAYATGTYNGPHDSNDDTATYQNGNFGHLPSAYLNMNLYNEGGAFALNGTTFLGASVTTNATDGINSATYTYKATDDGITWTGNWNSGSGYATVIATCSPAGTRQLYFWIDWNNDKDFNESNEVYNLPVNCGPGGVSNSISFAYPSSVSTDGKLNAGTYYTRFRLYDTTPDNPQPYGIAKDGSGNPIVGEIEDPFITASGGGDTPTPVTVSYFRAQRQGNSVNFEWSTATETGNVGFNLYVEDGGQLTLINSELIPSQVTDSLERQDYTFSAQLAGNVFYIEDISIKGEARQHGPFQLGEEYGSLVEEDKIDQATIQNEHAGKHNARQDELKKNMKLPAAALEPAGGQPGMQLTTTLNLKVRQTGIYRVTYEMLRDAGLDLAGVPIAKITLTNRGQMVPVYVSGQGKFGPGGYIEFYGQALDTIYTDINIYTLQVSRTPANRIQTNNAQPGTGLTPPGSYLETLVVNRQRAYVDYAPGDDAWYDTSMMVYKSSKSWSFPFQVNGLADPSASATLQLVVWGVTDWPQSPDHHLVVKVNDVAVTDQFFNGLVEQRLQITLPAGTLHEGANTLQLTLPGDTGVKYDMVNLDQFNLTYPRQFQAGDGRLTFNAAGKAFKVSNLPSSNVVVYRMSGNDIMRLDRAKVQAVGGTFTASFAGTNEAATYVVTTAEALYVPVLEAVHVAADLSQPAQYLIISHPDFIGGLEPLVQAREAEGLTVSVVDVTDLYTQYTYGIIDPQAIQQYIAYAAQNLGVRYVLLVGGDTYDYRNYLGLGSLSFIPSLYVDTGPIAKFVPVDPLYADLNGDRVPDLALGRFPVRSTAELNLMINKTLAYAGKDYGRTAVFVSDKYDGIVSFKNISLGLSASMPANWSLKNIHLDDVSVAVARMQLLAAMNQGVALVTFTGHSSAGIWTFNNLFNTKHAAALTNAGRPFVVVQWGCWNTYTVDPVNNYLVQSFLFSGDRGAAVVLGASTLTNSASEELLGELLTPRMVTPGMTVGQALLEAKNELAQTHPELLYVLLGWSLMGDPALAIEP